MRLSRHEIITSRSISQRFREVIDASVAIRRRLWLEPGKRRDDQLWDLIVADPQNNCIFRSQWRSIAPTTSGNLANPNNTPSSDENAHYLDDKGYRVLRLRPVRLNPILRLREGLRRREGIGSTYRIRHGWGEITVLETNNVPALWRAGDQLRRQHLTDPPTRVAKVRLVGTVWRKNERTALRMKGDYKMVVREKEGVRIGDVLDAIVEEGKSMFDEMKSDILKPSLELDGKFDGDVEVWRKGRAIGRVSASVEMELLGVVIPFETEWETVK